MLHFEFPGGVPVVPGHVYVLELSTGTSGFFWKSSEFPNLDPYPSGYALLRGSPVWHQDYVFRTYTPRFISIDVKPGSDPNRIDPKSPGLTPVVILGSPDLDVLTVDGGSLRLGPRLAPTAHDLTDPEVLLDHLLDVDSDGEFDLLAHFRTNETGVACRNSMFRLTGEQAGGMPIEGRDRIVPTSAAGNPETAAGDIADDGSDAGAGEQMIPRCEDFNAGAVPAPLVP